MNEISEEEAVGIASGHVQNGELINVKKEFDDGRWTYEILIQNDSGLYEVEIDAVDGSLIELEKKRRRASSSSPAISEDQAVEIVMERVGTGDNLNVRREFDDGGWEDEVFIRTEKGDYEVEIDGDSGRVKEVERKGRGICKGAGALIVILGAAMVVITILSVI